MKHTNILLLLGLLLSGATNLYAADAGLEKFMTSYDYATRKDMKIDSKTLVPLLKTGEAQLVDIRFREENVTWKVNPSISIPLNELPKRLGEIDTRKSS